MRINAKPLEVDEYDCTFFPDGRKAKDVVFYNPDLNEFPDSIPLQQQARKTVGQLVRKGFIAAPFTAVAQACDDCNACVPLRINTQKFSLNKNQKRVLAKFENSGFELLQATSEQTPPLIRRLNDLYEKYINWRFPGTPMTELKDYERAAFILESPNISIILDGSKPIAFALTSESPFETTLDVIAYDPDYKKYSLGSLLFIKSILSAHDNIVPYVYIGMTNESKALKYKQGYSGLETFDGDQWIDYKPETQTQGPNYQQIIRRMDIG